MAAAVVVPSDKTRVLFNEVIAETISPPEIPGRPSVLSYAEIQKLVGELREKGWNMRAIVTKRVLYSEGRPNYFEMAKCQNWGMVVDLRTTAAPITGEPYAPLRVLWAKGSIVSGHWPEELVLIYPAVDNFAVEEIVKRQIFQ